MGKTDLEEASCASYAASSKGRCFEPIFVLTNNGPLKVATLKSAQNPTSNPLLAGLISACLFAPSAPVTACPGANELSTLHTVTAIASMKQCHISTRSSYPQLLCFLSGEHQPNVIIVLTRKSGRKFATDNVESRQEVSLLRHFRPRARIPFSHHWLHQNNLQR